MTGQKSIMNNILINLRKKTQLKKLVFLIIQSWTKIIGSSNVFQQKIKKIFLSFCLSISRFNWATNGKKILTFFRLLINTKKNFAGWERFPEESKRILIHQRNTSAKFINSLNVHKFSMFSQLFTSFLWAYWGTNGSKCFWNVEVHAWGRWW